MALAASGAFDLWLAWRLRREVCEIVDGGAREFNDLQRDYDDLHQRFDDLARTTEMMTFEHATTAAALARFTGLWLQDERDEAVKVLQEAGFRIAA